MVVTEHRRACSTRPGTGSGPGDLSYSCLLYLGVVGMVNKSRQRKHLHEKRTWSWEELKQGSQAPHPREEREKAVSTRAGHS